jgi:transcriptional regulator NrdR family protein
MQCPECGTKLSSVLESRHTKAGYTRHRLCYNGHKFRTAEIIIPFTTKEERCLNLKKGLAKGQKLQK